MIDRIYLYFHEAGKLHTSKWIIFKNTIGDTPPQTLQAKSKYTR